MSWRTSVVVAMLAVASAAGAQTSYPDLVGSVISAPATITQGTTVDVRMTVRNAGAVTTARAFDVSVALTQDGWLCTQLIFCDESDNDWYVGTTSVPAGLAPGQELEVTVPVAIPADIPIGTWDLIGLVDGPVTHGYGLFESNESNNQAYGRQVQIAAPQTGYPDLVATAASFPTTLAQGASGPVSVTIRNAGFSATNRAMTVSIGLTRDGWLCTQLIFCDESDDDWFVGSTTVPMGFAPGAELTVTFPISIPEGLEPAAWDVIALADGPVTHGLGVFESNENNNQLRAGQILITVP